jgi:hypothetical protein
MQSLPPATAPDHLEVLVCHATLVSSSATGILQSSAIENDIELGGGSRAEDASAATLALDEFVLVSTAADVDLISAAVARMKQQMNDDAQLHALEAVADGSTALVELESDSQLGKGAKKSKPKKKKAAKKKKKKAAKKKKKGGKKKGAKKKGGKKKGVCLSRPSRAVKFKRFDEPNQRRVFHW